MMPKLLKAQIIKTQMRIPVETTTETTEEIKVAVVNNRNDMLPVVETEKKFSVRQSNILFLLFCMSSSLCIFGDLWHQWIRGKNVNHNTA